MLSVAESRKITDIPAILRLDLTKNGSLSLAVDFHHGLLGLISSSQEVPFERSFDTVSRLASIDEVMEFVNEAFDDRSLLGEHAAICAARIPAEELNARLRTSGWQGPFLRAEEIRPPAQMNTVQARYNEKARKARGNRRDPSSSGREAWSRRGRRDRGPVPQSGPGPEPPERQSS